MRKSTIVQTIAGLLLISQINTVWAAQVWDLYNFKVKPADVSAFVSAFNRLQESEAGKSRVASVHLQRTVFGGEAGATHAIVALYPSRAEFERASQMMNGTAEWRVFQRTMANLAEPVGNSAMETLKGWGTVSNDDVIWEAIRVNVTDTEGFLKAFDSMMASDEAKSFPGELWLSAISYGNASVAGTATHTITVGYETMAEMEAWNDQFRRSSAWRAFQLAIQNKMTLVNRELVSFMSVYDHEMSIESFKQ